MNRPLKPRFIAGATCPQCGEMDSIQHWPDSDEIACVSCDFRQSAAQRDAQNQPTKSAGRAIHIKTIND